MGRYIAQRLLQGVVTIWLVTLGIFGLLRLAGDPVSFMLPPDASREDRERLTALYGFNDPLWQQYLVFNRNLLNGRFGPSLRWDSRDGMEVFLARLPATLQLTGAAMSFSLILGVVLGAVSATHPDSLFDRVGKVLAIVGQSMPVFWVGILLILLFTVYLGWLPSAGGLDRLGLKGLILPAVTLGWLFVAAHMRIVRSSMLDVLDSDYIKMVRAKGMPKRLVIWRHALKNAAIPDLYAVCRELCPTAVGRRGDRDHLCLAGYWPAAGGFDFCAGLSSGPDRGVFCLVVYCGDQHYRRCRLCLARPTDPNCRRSQRSAAMAQSTIPHAGTVAAPSRGAAWWVTALARTAG